MAVDGVAPCSKNKTTKIEGLKNILEKREHNKIKDELNIKYETDYWDSNCIS